MHNTHTFSIGLVNPKSAVNVASVLRAAGCYGASSVFYTGQRYRYAKEFHADTQDFYKKIPTVGVDDLRPFVPKGARTIAVELVEGAESLIKFQHPPNAFYVLGPEDGSLKKNTLNWCDDVVYIPTRHCMNLAATVNVVLYDRLVKLNEPFNQAIILQGRDRNNNQKI
ncbi:RNA methyltransferase [Alteromonas sp. ASW11-130]|uniref:RNA methyltransferase n=1 Tax=Alteromonas sp. ASW11-130 TaxID=3015775 RepID=UPI0022424B52|nr:RNA methyltransferase [Alteromonas sp. ASW11-130]MCW8092188.1 RNA methyltransferase [Alteromonas sp. ASW11-130]